MKILLATYDLQPPWDSGHKVYGKGLLDAIQKIDGADITTARALDRKSIIEDGYDFVHVILSGSDPLTKALKIFKKARIFKHILTPSIGLRSSVNTKVYYTLMDILEKRLTRCFSSDFVANSYFMSAGLIVPPAIDTSLFTGSAKVDEAEILAILEKSETKIGLDNIKGNSNGLILYSGPLSEDRFPYQLVLKAISDTKSKILIIGRTSNNGPGVEKVKEIIDFAKKLGIQNRVAIVLKSLSQDEKIKMINFSNVIVQPFTRNTQQFVAVDPPFFLLESMSCEKPVITSKTYSFQSLIKNGINGYSIDWNDSKELDGALTDCLASKHIAAKARETILQSFSLELVSEKLRRIYNDHQ